MSLTTKLLNAAMASSRQVNFHYDGHTKGVYVHWYKNDTIEDGQEYSDHAYIDWDNADERLAEMLEKVEMLG